MMASLPLLSAQAPKEDILRYKADSEGAGSSIYHSTDLQASYPFSSDAS